MNRDDFVDSTFGKIVTEPVGPWPHPYFLPAPIPRTLSVSPGTMSVVSRADLALGRLSGLAMLLGDPHLLLGPSMAAEALSSSRIEGTQASLSDVLSARNIDGPVENEDLRDVSNYLTSVEQGQQLLTQWPLTQRLFCAIHETLLGNVRGEEKSPGEIRRSPVWIGSPDASPQSAKFIPPHQDRLGDAIADWERFVNEPSDMPSVIRAALAHYQFETIHPFLDGNGRIGRVLIGLQLMSDHVLEAPILSISRYFERHREEYYRRLQAVRERAEIEEWLQFFCAGIEQQADETSTRIRALIEIRERYRRDALNDRSALATVIDLIFRNPVVTVGALQRFAGISQPTASAALRKAESRGWLRSAGRWGRGGRERWIATEIWSALTDEPAFDTDPTQGTMP